MTPPKPGEPGADRERDREHEVHVDAGRRQHAAVVDAGADHHADARAVEEQPQHHADRDAERQQQQPVASSRRGARAARAAARPASAGGSIWCTCAPKDHIRRSAMTIDRPIVTIVCRRSSPGMRRKIRICISRPTTRRGGEAGGDREQPRAGALGDEEADVAAEQVQRAVREVDVAHQPEHQREAARDDEVERAEREPVEQRDEEEPLVVGDRPDREHGDRAADATAAIQQRDTASASRRRRDPCGTSGRGVRRGDDVAHQAAVWPSASAPTDLRLLVEHAVLHDREQFVRLAQDREVATADRRRRAAGRRGSPP